MKIVNVILTDDGNTTINTDTGQEIVIQLKQYFRIPQPAMRIDFKSEDDLKAFCIENQVMDY